MKLNDAVKGQTANIVHPERGAWTQQLEPFHQLSVPVLPRSLPPSSTDLSATPAGRLEVLLHGASRHVRSSRNDKIHLKTVQLTAVHPCGRLRTPTRLLCSMSNTRGGKKKNCFCWNALPALVRPPAAWPCSSRRELQEEGLGFWQAA